jgi:HEAT repeat protein
MPRANRDFTSETSSAAADHDIIESLIKDLSRHKVHKRYQAAERLATLGGRAKAARDQLEAVLSKDESALVRKSAALALGCLEDPAALETLIVAQEKDEDRYVREMAGHAIKELRATSDSDSRSIAAL